MHLTDWAFEQQLPTAEKLVLVYLASHANSAGLGALDRESLMLHTGYKKRSIQRLLKALRASGHYRELGKWYVIGKKVSDRIEPLPSKVPVLGLDNAQAGDSVPAFDADAIGEAIAKHVIDAAEYHMDQLQNFETRFAQQVERLALFHVERQEVPAAPPPDPVTVNPLYQQLIDQGMAEKRAYALSQADLDMGEELDSEAPAAVDNADDAYANTASGRFDRILDILHGSEAKAHDSREGRVEWSTLEREENKHTVKGEPDAFELLYPAIVVAAKANVGKLSMAEFCNPANVAAGLAPWDVEINPIDKDDPALMAEITVMLAELEQANDPRCQVQPRTKEIGDDGVERTETVLGFHRRITAKHQQMLNMKTMEIL